MFNRFQCRHLGDYHDLYLKSDVLLLADVFENFRNICIEYYDLDPAHFIQVRSKLAGMSVNDWGRVGAFSRPGYAFIYRGWIKRRCINDFTSICTGK